MKPIVVLLFFSISLKTFSQSGAIPPVLRSQITMDEIARGPIKQGSSIYGIPLKPPGLEGDFFIDKKWNVTTIVLYENEKLLEGYLTRFHLRSRFLEIRIENGIKVLDVTRIMSLVWLDSLTKAPRYFVNAKNYRLNNTRLEGLLEVLVDGELPLFKFISITVKKADYNVALDVGSKDHKVFKKEIFYYVLDNNLVHFKGKKSLSRAFADKTAFVEEFIKKNNLSYSKESDRIKIFDYYNTLKN